MPSHSFFDLIEIGVRKKIFNKNLSIGTFTDAMDQANRIFECCEKNDIEIINACDAEFPKSLIFDDGPQLIYYKGDLSILDNAKCAAVIGTRVPSEKGYDFAYQCGKWLAENHFTVVSGLALGCDTGAHKGCMEAGGKTAAFVPSNLSTITPAKQQLLAEQIVEKGGCLISEFSPFDTTSAYMFVERDRLQAGCSQFVIASEFAANSGTLHTLCFARDYKKPVYADKRIVDDPSIDGYAAMEAEGIAYTALSDAELRKLIETYE